MIRQELLKVGKMIPRGGVVEITKLDGEEIKVFLSHWSQPLIFYPCCRCFFIGRGVVELLVRKAMRKGWHIVTKLSLVTTPAWYNDGNTGSRIVASREGRCCFE